MTSLCSIHVALRVQCYVYLAMGLWLAKCRTLPSNNIHPSSISVAGKGEIIRQKGTHKQAYLILCVQITAAFFYH